MVYFRLKEDYDFAGGFLAASFALLYEMCTSWLWHFIPLLIITAVFNSYKSLMFEGEEAVAP